MNVDITGNGLHPIDGRILNIGADPGEADVPGTDVELQMAGGAMGESHSHIPGYRGDAQLIGSLIKVQLAVAGSGLCLDILQGNLLYGGC